MQISVNPKGGVPKFAVPHARISTEGVEGDKQRDRRFHGGPDRAVCLYSLEVIQALQAEGHPIDCGTTGENLTIAGLDWNLVVSGARLQIGEVRLKVTRYTTPCYKIKESFLEGNFNRVHHKKQLGWSRVYARVLQEGVVRVSDAVKLESVR